MTMEQNRAVTLADLHSAVETIALAQAQTGVAVMALLNNPTSLSDEQRGELAQRVQKNTVQLLELSRSLLDAHDGS